MSLEIPYSQDDRVITLQRAANLLNSMDLEEGAEILLRRIDDVRAGTCAHINAVAPDLVYERQVRGIEEETIADLEEDPYLLMEWQGIIHALCRLICVARSEDLGDLDEMLFLRLSDFHPASPIIIGRTMAFNTRNATVSIDSLIELHGLHAAIMAAIGVADETEDIHPDAPIEVLLAKTGTELSTDILPATPIDAIELRVHYARRSGEKTERSLPFADMASLESKKREGAFEEAKHKLAQKLMRGLLGQMRSGTTKRNDPCPCGSGCKFKKCCMRYS